MSTKELCADCSDRMSKAKPGSAIPVCSDCSEILKGEGKDKNAMTLMEELTEKFGVDENVPPENNLKISNKYGRRSYDRGPESEGE